jgi:enterochelin esterase-like enzyme
MSPSRGSGRLVARAFGLAGAAVVVVFLAVGFVGVKRYGINYWLYRGFPPPQDPAYVKESGREEQITVNSPALGGRSQQVYVYLPPGYDEHPEARYPVLYLLHGFPGRPLAFLLTVRLGVVEDELYAKQGGLPPILVMPFGSTGTFTDKEWANGTGSDQGWATFVARDVVHAIDARYRTLPSAAGRGIAGLSEGGYGAINIALHHPHEFSLVESWSGYEKAPHIRSIFGAGLENVPSNSPLDVLPSVASAIRGSHMYFWFYAGSDDPLSMQNAKFASELRRLRIPHQFFLFSGGHDWALWRGQAGNALLVATERLAHG